MSPDAARVENTIPVLPVRNLARSLEFYTQTLGFRLDWGGGEGRIIASVSRDGCPIMLAEGFSNAPPNGSGSAWPMRRCLKYGDRPESGPAGTQNWPWAYEMKFGRPGRKCPVARNRVCRKRGERSVRPPIHENTPGPRSQTWGVRFT